MKQQSLQLLPSEVHQLHQNNAIQVDAQLISLLQTKVTQAMISAPTGDNCQPFLFKWKERRVQIFVNTELTKHALNQREIPTQLALGGVIELASLAAQQFHFQTHTEFHTQKGFTSNNPWVTLTFDYQNSIQSNSFESMLFDTILIRHVNRKLLKGGELPQELTEELNRQNQSHLNIRTTALHFKNFDPDQLNQLIQLMTREELPLFTHQKLFKDISKWFRISHQHAYKSRDGLRLNQLPIKNHEQWMFKLFYFFPKLMTFFCRMGMSRLIQKELEKTFLSSAGLYIFWGPVDSQPKDFYQIGRNSLRLWLALNARGFGVVPQTTLTLLLTARSIYPETHETLSDSRTTFKEISLIRKLCGVEDENLFPYWGLRTGLSEPLPTEIRALRRDKKKFLL